MRSLLKPDEAVTLWAISVDEAEKSKGLAEKIASNGKGSVTFPILSDPNHKVIDAYGLADPRYAGQKLAGIPYPAVYVIDKKGKIAWERIEKDYKLRWSNLTGHESLDRIGV